MNRGDVVTVFEVLPTRLRRRVVALVVVVVTVAGVVAPGLHLRERVFGWWVSAYTEQLHERLDDVLSGLLPSVAPPTHAPDGR